MGKPINTNKLFGHDDNYVSLETAKALRDIGFGSDSIGLYPTYYEDGIFHGDFRCIGKKERIDAPILQIAMRYLRDTYGIEIEIHYYLDKYRDYEYKRGDINWKSTSFKWYDSWEDCADDTIKRMVELIKVRKFQKLQQS